MVGPRGNSGSECNSAKLSAAAQKAPRAEMNVREADWEVTRFRADLLHVRGDCADLRRKVDTLAALQRYAEDFLRLDRFFAPGGFLRRVWARYRIPVLWGVNSVTKTIVDDRRLIIVVTGGLSRVGDLTGGGGAGGFAA